MGEVIGLTGKRKEKEKNHPTNDRCIGMLQITWWTISTAKEVEQLKSFTTER